MSQWKLSKIADESQTPSEESQTMNCTVMVNPEVTAAALLDAVAPGLPLALERVHVIRKP